MSKDSARGYAFTPQGLLHFGSDHTSESFPKRSSEPARFGAGSSTHSSEIEFSLSALHCDIVLQRSISKAERQSHFAKGIPTPHKRTSLPAPRKSQPSLYKSLKSDLAEARRFEELTSSISPPTNAESQPGFRPVSSSSQVDFSAPASIVPSTHLDPEPSAHQWSDPPGLAEEPSLAFSLDPGDPLDTQRRNIIEAWHHYLLGDFKRLSTSTETAAICRRIHSQLNVAINQLASTESQILKIAAKIEKLLVMPWQFEHQQKYVLVSFFQLLLNDTKCRLAVNGRFVWTYAYLLSKLKPAVEGFENAFEAAMLVRCPYIYLSRGVLRPESPVPLSLHQDQLSYIRLWFSYHTLNHHEELCWIWFAKLLNQEPQAICASLLHGALSIAGPFILACYPFQFPKMLHVIEYHYFPRLVGLVTSDNEAIISTPLVHLQGLLASYRMSHSLPIADGYHLKQAETPLDLAG